jgi:gamma-glutamyltranspeptidase/glutathione hydrolase
MFYSRNFGLLAVLSMILFVAWLPGASTSPLEFSIRDTDHNNGQERGIGPGKLGAVATENAICSRHGIEMFEMGGNAADAVSTPCSERDDPGQLE